MKSAQFSQFLKLVATCQRTLGVLFHTDAVQAVGNVKINVKEENIDLLSLFRT